uniref:Kinesin-like protein KIF17 n=1 Tax=Acrobeloides nanus TaxID=290746 RepID=A0A914EIT8_9BILA
LPIDEKEAKKRLEILEQQLVGGEKANDEVLKQKRYKKMKEAEKKMQRLAQAIQNADHDDPLLQAYSSTQEKLDALVKKFNYEVQKVRSLESEIQDITAEFELDRLDYLETIRKQDQQLKLCQQILEKIQPAIKKDSNYYDIEKIKKSAVWNEDQSRWILQELQMNRHILPNAHNVMPAASAELNHFSDTDEMDDSRLKKRLERSMEEDFVKSYFKQINKNDLINKYKSDKYQNNSQEKISNFMKRNQRVNGLMNGVVYTDDIYTNGNNNESNGMHRVISGKKKPQRLESLNVSRNRV